MRAAIVGPAAVLLAVPTRASGEERHVLVREGAWLHTAPTPSSAKARAGWSYAGVVAPIPADAVGSAYPPPTSVRAMGRAPAPGTRPGSAPAPSSSSARTR